MLIGFSARVRPEDAMATEWPHSKTFPDQPASNSGAAVGFIIGGVVGIALALTLAAEPWLAAYPTPVVSIIGGCVAGMLCGSIIGAFRDAYL
jgi:ABC-type nitrate/sulfonate/bicarbonate transport system permease component